ncbi:MAG: ABC transporter permease [Alphaproteobacteria bacterium]|nr:ABC transporter permease [Alphaproteobacteria bacterium]
MGVINWVGFWTLYTREVWRFVKVATQTIMAPVVTTLLFLAVFLLALGGAGRSAGGLPYGEFLAPGLIIMAMMQNAFANTSSSVIISKVQGNIVDVLMPPLSGGELTLAFSLGGMTRGVVVGAVVSLAIWCVVPLRIHDLAALVFYGLSASLFLSLLGLLGGVWAEKFDHIAAVTNFVVTPLSFLSGTFYSIDRLPGQWRLLAHLNPFFYMIDGFRYAFTGSAGGSLAIGVATLVAMNAALLTLCFRLIARGYKLKA